MYKKYLEMQEMTKCNKRIEVNKDSNKIKLKQFTVPGYIVEKSFKYNVGKFTRNNVSEKKHDRSVF